MKRRVAIVGAGPAGLACAEVLAAYTDYEITIYEQKPSAARKFLMAGKTGLNISHSEPLQAFILRYDHAAWLAPQLKHYHAAHIQSWMQGLGIASYIGSSGRIFPNEMKAAPLLRAWLQRLQQQGVQFCYRHQVTALHAQQLTVINLKNMQQQTAEYDAIVLACGAVSWPQLGSDGLWQKWFDTTSLAPFQASNVGVLYPWSAFMQGYFGQPLKRIQAWTEGEPKQFGEMVITQYGLEGGLIYRCNRALRQQYIAAEPMVLHLDLLPDVPLAQIIEKLRQAKKQSLNTLWQKVGLDKTKIALVREVVNKADWSVPEKMALHFKDLAVLLQGFRPIAEAISCAGGLKLDVLDQHLKIKNSANIFACGEMLDWDAPTGGYLLTACLATGRTAGQGVHYVLSHEKKVQ